MFILSSLGRPDRIGAVVESYEWDTEKVILALYEGDKRLPEYLAQQWPESWTIEIVPMRGNGPTYNEILRRHPDEQCYGFLADDAILDVPGMLRRLAEAADSWNVAYANDKHHGAAIPTMPCMGGELVRAIGYLSPRCLIHWGIDCAWKEIGERLGALRYFENLTYTHLNPVWGTAADDSTYVSARLNSYGYETLLRGWAINELPRDIERVRRARLKVAA